MRYWGRATGNKDQDAGQFSTRDRGCSPCDAVTDQEWDGPLLFPAWKIQADDAATRQDNLTHKTDSNSLFQATEHTLER